MPKNHAAQVESAGRVARKPEPKSVLPPIPKAPNLNPFINEGKPADPLPPASDHHPKESKHG